MYTHPFKLRVPIRKYTQTCNSVYRHIYMNTNTYNLCVYIRNHIHTHPNSVYIYVNIYTPKCKRRVHIHVYRHTHMETLCVCTSIYKHKMNSVRIYTEIHTYPHVNSVYVYGNIHTPTRELHMYKHKTKSVRICGNTYIPTCEPGVSMR